MKVQGCSGHVKSCPQTALHCWFFLLMDESFFFFPLKNNLILIQFLNSWNLFFSEHRHRVDSLHPGVILGSLPTQSPVASTAPSAAVLAAVDQKHTNPQKTTQNSGPVSSFEDKG